MSGGAREKDQADFDLERFIDMFDTAMTSNDPRVVETLRKLMMIVALTAPETPKEHGRNNGPLRRMFEDMHHLNQRMHRMQDDLEKLVRDQRSTWPEERTYRWSEDKYTMAAAAQMAQSIDDDVMRKITQKINSPGINSSNQKPPAGKLYK